MEKIDIETPNDEKIVQVVMPPKQLTPAVPKPERKPASTDQVTNKEKQPCPEKGI